MDGFSLLSLLLSFTETVVVVLCIFTVLVEKMHSFTPLSIYICFRSVWSLSAVKLVGFAVIQSTDRQTDRQMVIVNDSDVSLSVTRIHPVVML